MRVTLDDDVFVSKHVSGLGAQPSTDSSYRCAGVADVVGDGSPAGQVNK